MGKSYTEDELFCTVPVGKAIATLAVPTVISQIVTVIYNMADTFFIGQMGDPNQVAATTVAMPFFVLIVAISNLFGIGGASLISRSLGMGRREKAGRCSAFCIWSGIAVSLIYGLLVLAFKSALLPVLGADSETMQFASDYVLWTVTVGAVPSVLNPMVAHLVRAEGHSKQASFGVAMGGILNIVLDPLFIFVFDLEIVGAAIATLISNIIAVIYYLAFLYRIRKTTALSISPLKFTLKERVPSEVLSVGLPSFLISLMACISNTVLVHTISTYSNKAIAGIGIAKKIDILAFAIAQGMTQGAIPLFGYNYSARNYKRMLEAAKKLFAACVLVALAGMALLFFCAGPVTRLFINDAETVEHGKIFLQIISTSCLATTLSFFGIAIFQAIGQKVPPIIISLLRKGTTDVVLMFLFNKLFGLYGVACGTPVAEYVCCVISLALVIPFLKKLRPPA